jgi:fucose 4-O-acetylase-like acetyltransferase
MPRVRARIPHLDNAKLALIALVVLGHMLEPLLGRSATADATYRALYLFHMPAFVFLAGITSRPRIDRHGVLGLLLPLLVFQVLYAVPLSLLTGHAVTRPLQPYWVLWFLLSLLCWRLALPLLCRARHPLALSVALALAFGYLPIDRALCLSRTFVFLPFFVAGHLYGASFLEKLAGSPHWLPILAAAALGLLGTASAALVTDVRWLYGADGYATLGASGVAPVLRRAVQLAASGASVAAFCALVPRAAGRLTARGARTLTVFLLHVPVVLLLRDPIASLYPRHPALVAFLIVAVALGTTLLLSTRLVDHALRELFRALRGALAAALRLKPATPGSNPAPVPALTGTSAAARERH